MDTSIEESSFKAPTLVRIETSVAAMLDRMGYRLLVAEIDAAVGRARIEVRRHDGYTLTLDIRPNASSITREMLRREAVAVGRRGDRFLADRLSMQFLGRSRVAGIGGARAALRVFADTISANTTSATSLDAHAAIGLLGASLVNEPG